MGSIRLPASLTVLLVALQLASPAPAAAQTGVAIEARGGVITVGGRLQPQFQASTAEGAAADVFFRRARLRIDVTVSELVDARLNPDFAGDGTTLADAWVRFSPSPSFRLSFGQFKRAFSRFELASSTDLPVIERDGRIRGVGGCPGVGGVCSFSRLTQKLGFDGRDVGVRVQGSLGGGVGYLATLTNGEGANRRDTNDGMSASGRLTLERGPVTVGVFGALQDVPGAGEGETEHEPAGGVDVELGTWRDGLHLIAGVAFGENWRAGPDASFGTFELLASYYAGTGRAHLAGVEPLLRIGWTDPDDGADDAGGLLVTPGVMLYTAGKNGVSLNVDVYSPSGGADTELSLKVQSFLYF